MYKNWIDVQELDLRPRVSSEQVIAKPISIKDPGGKSSAGVLKAVELIRGDLLHVSDSWLRMK
jgi:hypothetical protein